MQAIYVTANEGFTDGTGYTYPKDSLVYEAYDLHQSVPTGCAEKIYPAIDKTNRKDYVWDTSTLEMISDPQPAKIDRGKLLDALTLDESDDIFGFEEDTNLSAVNRKRIRAGLRYTEQHQNIPMKANDAKLDRLINACVSAGYLTPARVAEIITAASI